MTLTLSPFFASVPIHPAVAMLALIIADVWAMNRHYRDGSRYDTADPGATGTAHHKRK